jgi:hypothetical protein
LVLIFNIQKLPTVNESLLGMRIGSAAVITAFFTARARLDSLKM